MYDRVLETVACEQLGLLCVGEEAELDQHCRHVRRLEHAQRGAVDGPRRERHAVAELLLDDVGECFGSIEMARLREVPWDQLELARAAAESGKPLAAAGRRRMCRVLIERGAK